MVAARYFRPLESASWVAACENPGLDSGLDRYPSCNTSWDTDAEQWLAGFATLHGKTDKSLAHGETDNAFVEYGQTLNGPQVFHEHSFPPDWRFNQQFASRDASDVRGSASRLIPPLHLHQALSTAVKQTPEVTTSSPAVEKIVKSLQHQEATTVMIRNIPACVKQPQLLNELTRHSFDEQFDFCYLPADFATHECKGYAFINFTSLDAVARFVRVFHGSRCFGQNSTLNVSAAAVQGQEANVQRWGSRVRRIRNPELKPFVVSPRKTSPTPSGACTPSTIAPPPGLESSLPSSPETRGTQASFSPSSRPLASPLGSPRTLFLATPPGLLPPDDLRAPSVQTISIEHMIGVTSDVSDLQPGKIYHI